MDCMSVDAKGMLGGLGRSGMPWDCKEPGRPMDVLKMQVNRWDHFNCTVRYSSCRILGRGKGDLCGEPASRVHRGGSKGVGGMGVRSERTEEGTSKRGGASGWRAYLIGWDGRL